MAALPLGGSFVTCGYCKAVPRSAVREHCRRTARRARQPRPHHRSPGHPGFGRLRAPAWPVLASFAAQSGRFAPYRTVSL